MVSQVRQDRLCQKLRSVSVMAGCPRCPSGVKENIAERFQLEINQDSSEFQIGNDLDDNAIQDDGYRYHDVIHLAHATVLGWSPVLRALIGDQRRHVGDCDRLQDGARAKAIEEGLAACVFNYLAPYQFADIQRVTRC